MLLFLLQQKLLFQVQGRQYLSLYFHQCIVLTIPIVIFRLLLILDTTADTNSKQPYHLEQLPLKIVEKLLKYTQQLQAQNLEVY